MGSGLVFCFFIIDCKHFYTFWSFCLSKKQGLTPFYPFAAEIHNYLKKAHL